MSETTSRSNLILYIVAGAIVVVLAVVAVVSFHRTQIGRAHV